MPVVVLEGNPRKRGQIHGETLKELIQEHIGRMKGFVGESLQKDPDEGLKEFFAETDFISAIQQWTPDLMEEMKGTAEAAGVTFEDIFALNCGDETWWYFYEKKGLFNSPTVGAENCSSLGVEPGESSPALVAQNLDIPAYYDGLQVLLHIKDHVSSLETLAISFAGVVGAVGMNSRGVGMCENTLIDLKHSAAGLPVMHVSRGILAQPTLEDAISFVHRIRHASGQNYVIGSPDGVVDYECSANKVRRFVPFEGAKMVYHTNHAFVNADTYEIRKSPENSISRFGSVERNLKGVMGPITVEDIKRVLSSHENAPNEVCVHPSDEKKGITANCLIMELSTEPRMHYTAGPPCETDFLTVTFG